MRASQVKRTTGVAVLGALLSAGAMMGTAPEAAAEGGLDCDSVESIENHTRITHNCTGTGTVTYTRDCFIGSVEASYKFDGGTEEVYLALDCGLRGAGTRVTYTVS